MKIFLSGGTHGDWQDRVIESLRSGGVQFYDPRSLRDQPMQQIALTERRWLDECDCLFFYFEASNPSGLGSAFEVGYCIAKGTPVIYVDEQHTSHSEWLSYHCDAVADNLTDGIARLKHIVASVRR